jgi:cobyric acid synthase
VEYFVIYCFSDDNTTDSESEAHLTEAEEAKGYKIINGITTAREGKSSGSASDMVNSFKIW